MSIVAGVLFFENIEPLYGNWKEVPGFSKEKLRKAHATYCGKITMVDTWLGYFLDRVENMGLMEKTAIIFTSDHGFYFGEHGGIFGKMVFQKRADGTYPVLEGWDDPEEGGRWSYCPLYEEVAGIPLLIYVPGISPGVYRHLTSVVDIMPTILDVLKQDIPDVVEGESLLPKLYDPALPGRDFTISGIPFANPGDPIRAVDSLLRMLEVPTVTTISTPEWSLLYCPEAGKSMLYNLASDPKQQNNVISSHPDMAKVLHGHLVQFMRDTKVPDHLLTPRLELIL